VSSVSNSHNFFTVFVYLSWESATTEVVAFILVKRLKNSVVKN